MADMYVVLSAILKWDVSKKLRMTVLKVTGGCPN